MTQVNKREFQGKSIVNKIFKIQNQIGGIVKDKKNPHFKNDYTDINSLLKQLQPLFEKHGVIVQQPTRVDESGNQRVMTILRCKDTGEFDSSDLIIPFNDNPQRVGSAITYYKRYTLFGLLGLNTEEDDDGQAALQTTAVKKLSQSQYQATLKGTKEQAEKVLKGFNVTDEQKKGIETKFNL